MRHTGGALAVAVVAAASALGTSFYPDEPPPATTGGFGEPTCASCHSGANPDSTGTLALEGLPGTYEPGRVYDLAVVLSRPGMERAGFQLASRFGEAPSRGEQAGGLRAEGEYAAVLEVAGIQYAHPTAAGSARVESGRARWRVEWTAPAGGAGRVLFHVVGNAANGDASALGDRV